MTTRAWLRVDACLRRLARLRGSTAYQHAVLPFVGSPVDCQDWGREWAKQWRTTRMHALDTWLRLRREGATDFTPYYQEPYFLLRQVWFRRYDRFHAILQTAMGAEEGHLVDYGCGAGMVSGWLQHRRPFWRVSLVDVPSPALTYAARPYRGLGGFNGFRHVITPHLFDVGVLWKLFDVTLCLDTFEHLPRPHDVLVTLLRRTRLGGHLFLSMSPDRDGENIGGAYRADVLALLARYCDTRLSMEAVDTYGHYIKREEP